MTISILQRNYKVLSSKEWDKFPGKLAGSSRPGLRDEHIYSQVEQLEVIERVNILDDLSFIYDQNIRIIYGLTNDNDSINRKLTKSLWEMNFSDSLYITEINNISTSIQDFNPPTQEQLHLIVADIIERLTDGKNILVHCAMGKGRTGTILTAVYMQAFNVKDAEEAINYIRENYLSGAVETIEQIESLKVFGSYLE